MVKLGVMTVVKIATEAKGTMQKWERGREGMKEE